MFNAEDEPNILARAREFDQNTLALIHDTYYRPIFRYISFRVSDPDTAEDLTSEVFMRLLSALRQRTVPQRNLGG